MVKQIKKLSFVQLRNLFGINEIRYTKDSQKRNRYFALMVAWVVLILMAVFYVMMMSVGLVRMGLSGLIPGFLFAISSVMVLFFSIFKAGSVIFQKNSYEMMVSLPVSNAAIVISRFMTMYVTNMLLGILIMLPGVLVYAVSVKPSVSFYIYSILGIGLMPLLPLTIATALGAGVTAVTARMKHKSLVSAIVSLIFCLAVVFGSMMLSGPGTQMSEEMLKNLAETMNKKVGQMYFPALWYGRAATAGSLMDFLLLAGISIGLFVILVAVLQKNFLSVCTALNATAARNDYKMQKLTSHSRRTALLKKEGKRYFASSIYVSNTMFGLVIMVILALALFFVGPEKVEKALQIPNITKRIMPVLLSAMAVMTLISACSISMEGKEWWRLQTLPIRKKDIWNTKIVFPLILSLPFYLIAEVFTILALKPTVLGIIWLLLIPALYMVFTAVLGVAANLAMPVFDWENEVRVVKQSASVTITLFAGLFAVAVPLVGVLAARGREDMVYLIVSLVLLVVDSTIYCYIMKRYK